MFLFPPLCPVCSRTVQEPCTFVCSILWEIDFHLSLCLLISKVNGIRLLRVTFGLYCIPKTAYKKCSMPRLSKDDFAPLPDDQLPAQDWFCREWVERETVFGIYFDCRTQMNVNVPAPWLFHFLVAVWFSVLRFLSSFICSPFSSYLRRLQE